MHFLLSSVPVNVSIIVLFFYIEHCTPDGWISRSLNVRRKQNSFLTKLIDVLEIIRNRSNGVRTNFSQIVRSNFFVTKIACLTGTRKL
uniref:Uncharacterized protein n=1 Tax=Sphingobacterium sp. (strain 21) TaxID=743722 RepID=F4C9R4_SPHS2